MESLKEQVYKQLWELEDKTRFIPCHSTAISLPCSPMEPHGERRLRPSPCVASPIDGETIPLSKRHMARQKVNFLELMLGQIANYCPVISRNTLVKNSTSIQSVWNMICAHFGFQITGAHFLDFANLHLEADERPEDFFQRLMAFVEDTLLRANSLSHHGEATTEDEDLTATLENFIVLTWLKLIHPDLPKLVKQRYGTELRSRTLCFDETRNIPGPHLLTWGNTHSWRRQDYAHRCW